MTTFRWQLGIALAAMLVVLAVLGSFALDSAASARTLDGRVYVEAVVGTVEQLNPLAQRDASPAERDIAALLFDGLTRIGPDGRAEPALAARWTPDDQGRTWIFVLRADARWHDGTPVTAGDVLFTVKAVQSDGFPGDPALSALWRDVRAVRQDDRTVRFELPSPFAAFPAVARLPILPAHLLADVPPEQWPGSSFGRRPIGNGPFRLAALDTQLALLQPTTGDAAIDHLVLRFYPSADSALHALSRHEVQGFAMMPAAGRRVADPAPRTVRRALPAGETTELALNLRQAPLDNVEFRRALAQALNRDLLIENVLGGRGRRLDTPVLPGTWAAEPRATLPPYQRSAAQQALGRLGYVERAGVLERDGRPLSLALLTADTAGQAEIANEVARQLGAIGIRVEIRTVPAHELPARLLEHDWSLAIHSWSDVGADPDAYALWHSSRADGGANYAGLRDARSDELLERGLKVLGEAERRAAYADFQRRWVELVPSLPLFQSVLIYDQVADLPVPEAAPLTFDRGERFRVHE